jgi:acetyl-CoA acetyltransferase
MGQSCEIMAKTWKISREEQDQLAYESHVKAAKAYEEGFYDDLVVAYLGLKQDNNVRADTSMEQAREAEAGVRHVAARHADRRQLDAADRRRLGRCCSRARTGRARATCRCSPT